MCIKLAWKSTAFTKLGHCMDVLFGSVYHGHLREMSNMSQLVDATETGTVQLISGSGESGCESVSDSRNDQKLRVVIVDTNSLTVRARTRATRVGYSTLHHTGCSDNDCKFARSLITVSEAWTSSVV